MHSDRPLRIEPARHDDASRIVSIIADAYAPYLDRMDRKPAPMRDDYPALIERGVVTVAENRSGSVDGVIVMWPDGDAMYVDNLAVDPHGQGSGIGSALLAEAERRAIAIGATSLALHTNEVMTETLEFYLRHGFSETRRSTDTGFSRIHLTRPVGFAETSATDVQPFAIAARVKDHGLIAAECAALTGGVPDGDGVALCESVERIGRAAFVQSGGRVLRRAEKFDALVEAVAAAEFPGDRFRVDVHDPSNRIGRTSIQTAVALADVMPHVPDLDDPQHRFVVMAHAAGFVFGEIVATSDASYRRHDSKPWSTSSSLDSRFSRALVNLVPHARSILDPCCGAGSIVLEAASLGLDAFGVDWKPAMVGMTRENLAHFGERATVELADSTTHVQCVDAIVTDLPYGHAIDADEANVRAIIEQSARLAPHAVFVAPTDIAGWMSAAGYVDIVVHTVLKRRGFTRWIHVGRSSDD